MTVLGLTGQLPPDRRPMEAEKPMRLFRARAGLGKWESGLASASSRRSRLASREAAVDSLIRPVLARVTV
jgi:hypothetical protein